MSISANTWTKISITIPPTSLGTWATNNTLGLQLFLSLGCGSTYGSGTAGAWANGFQYTASGGTSVVGTSGATFYITGVQLEKGTTATTFDFRDYGRELILCQRYYQQLSANGSGSNLALLAIGNVQGSGSSGFGGGFLKITQVLDNVAAGSQSGPVNVTNWSSISYTSVAGSTLLLNLS